MYGIIDIGSNTIRLKVYKNVRNKYKSIIDKKEFAKLISLREDDKLTSEGINLCAEILNEYKQILNMLKVTNYHAFATASFRCIKNVDEVLAKVKELTGIEIEVLSGEEEALYGYLGASQSIESESGAVLDIGGGSLELTFFNNNEIENKKSIPCGSLNMQELFLNKNSVVDFNTKDMKEYITKMLKEQGITEKKDVIYGVGGTIRALLKIKKKEDGIDTQEFSYDDVRRWYRMLKRDSISWLRLVLNIVPERTLTVSCGLIVLKTVMKYINANKVIVCENGVREGYLTHILQEA